MSHLTNAQIFKAIGLDESVNPSSKYTLLICVHVLMDWKAWSGHISADQLATATNQSSRGVQRHLKALVDAGWLFRHAEVRGPGLHHKSFTILNQDKVREVLKRAHDTTELVKPDTTELVSASTKVSSTSASPDTTELVKADTTELVDTKNDTPDVTELVKPDTTELVKPDVIETELTKSVVVDTTELVSTTTELVSDKPNLSYISISLNTNQYNSIEVEPESEAREELAWEYERGSIWCERCKRHVPNDRPHTYPHSQLICSDRQPSAEEVEQALKWDRAWGAAEEVEVKPEPLPMIERREGNLYFIDEIHDELTYKRQVYEVVNQPDTRLIREALWTRQGDHLYQQMKEERVAPRSAIDWVMLQAGREVTEPTPPPPPKPSNTWTVTVEEQIKIRQADQAWMSGQTNNGDNDTW